jgi:serine/threonine protein kinase
MSSSRSTNVEVISLGDNLTVAEKRAATDAARSRLSAEISALERCFLPGVIRLVGHGVREDGVWMRTQFAGANSLATGGLAPLARLTLIADACRCVATMHEALWAHGDLRPSHLIVNSSRRVSICSMGLASFPASAAAIAGDREQLANMMDDAILSIHEPLRGELLEVSARVRDESEPLWECARDLDDLTRHHPSGPVGDLTSARRGIRPFRPRAAESPWTVPKVVARLRTKTAIGASAVLGVLAVSVFALHAAASTPTVREGPRAPVDPNGALASAATSKPRPAAAAPSEKLRSRTVATSVPATTAAPASTASTDTSVPSASDSSQPPSTSPSDLLGRCPRLPDRFYAEVTPGACPEEVALEGSTVRVGSKSYSLGSPGDLGALGDFDCDGSDDLALLRPSTGEIFYFRTWTLAGPLTARAAAVRPGATRISVRERGDCDSIATADDSGVDTQLPLSAGGPSAGGPSSAGPPSGGP